MMAKLSRVFIVLGVLIASQSATHADISVNLAVTAGIQYPVSVFLPAGAYVQLVWSADNAYSGSGGNVTPYDFEAVADDYSAYGDYVLWSGLTTSVGGWAGDLDGAVNYLDTDVGGADINAGFLFAYVFQDGTPSGTDFLGRTAIFDTSTFGEQDGSVTPIPTPDTVDFAPSSTLVLDTYQLQVPEPSSMALMGIGLAVAGFARRRRKNS